MVYLVVLLGILPLVSADQKCFTNSSFITGVPEICANDLPFCCYDMIADYYCCQEEQLISVLKIGAIVFTIFLLLAIFVVTFVIVFVDIQIDVNSAPVTVQMTTLNQKDNIKDDGASFSVFFDQTVELTPDKEDKAQDIFVSKVPKKANEEENKPTIPVSPTAQETAHMPEKKASKDKLETKQKANKSDEKLRPEKKKTLSKTNFDENVERMKKSINK